MSGPERTSAQGSTRPAVSPGAEIVPVVAAAIIHRGRCLVGKRLPGGSAGGCWEFPGGKIEAGETPQEALQREIREELATDIEVGAWLGRGTAPSGKRLIVLDVYRARLLSESPPHTSSDHEEVRWVNALELTQRNWAPADVPLLEPVCALLGALEA